MKETKRTFIRQGDLLFTPREREVTQWEKTKGPARNGIIREGEATGHHHRLEDLESAEVYRPQWGQPIVVVGKLGATVVHPEHGPVTLEPNTVYDVNVAREWDITSGARYVAD